MSYIVHCMCMWSCKGLTWVSEENIITNERYGLLVNPTTFLRHNLLPPIAHTFLHVITWFCHICFELHEWMPTKWSTHVQILCKLWTERNTYQGIKMLTSWPLNWHRLLCKVPGHLTLKINRKEIAFMGPKQPMTFLMSILQGCWTSILPKGCNKY